MCECKYDEFHDRIDREDCPFHADLIDDEPKMDVWCTQGKGPALEAGIGYTGKRRAKTA